MAPLKAFYPSRFLAAMRDAYSETVIEMVAQLPWEPLAAEVVAEGGTHDAHEPEVSHGLGQGAEVVRTGQAVPLWQGGWGLLDSYSVVCGDRHEGCVVVVEVVVEVGAPVCSGVIQSTSCPNCLVSCRSAHQCVSRHVYTD